MYYRNSWNLLDCASRRWEMFY